MLLLYISCGSNEVHIPLKLRFVDLLRGQDFEKCVWLFHELLSNSLLNLVSISNKCRVKLPILTTYPLDPNHFIIKINVILIRFITN